MAQQNDIGTTITGTVKEGGTAIDINTASAKYLNLLSPGGTASENAANFTTDGSDGKIYITTIDGTVNEEGDWWIQAHIVMPGKNFKTKWAKKWIGANIVIPAP